MRYRKIRPKALSLGEIVKFAFSVLGLTWQNLRAKLVKAVGEPAVQAMEKGFDIVKTLVTKGPVAAWEQIKDELVAQKDKVVDGIKDMVTDAVVTKAIPKLIAMFIPGAGFISAIVSIYDIVMVFVQKISKIIQVVTAFVDSIVAIAAGAIGAAADKVESILAGLLSLAINFLAGFAGLGKIANKINEIVQKVRAPIEKALESMAAWVKKMATKFLDALKKGVKKLLNWWKKKVPFRTNEQEHSISVDSDSPSVDPVVKSKPTYLGELIGRITDDKVKKKAQAKQRQIVDLIKAGRQDKTPEALNQKSKDLESKLKEMGDILVEGKVLDTTSFQPRLTHSNLRAPRLGKLR